MRKNNKLPIILGRKPPTKDVLLIKTEKPLKGYSCLIFHADFPPDIESGQHIELSYKDMERKGLASWLHFVDGNAMRKFGQDLIDFANKVESEGEK